MRSERVNAPTSFIPNVIPFKLLSRSTRSTPAFKLVPRLSLLCLPLSFVVKAEERERAWEQGCPAFRNPGGSRNTVTRNWLKYSKPCDNSVQKTKSDFRYYLTFGLVLSYLGQLDRLRGEQHSCSLPPLAQTNKLIHGLAQDAQFSARLFFQIFPLTFLFSHDCPKHS